MPPKPKTKDEIKSERELILKNALEIIQEKGVNNLSMRTIAKKCNYSATKIYYYYESRDEIVFALIENGFNELRNSLQDKCDGVSDPRQKFITALDEINNFNLNKGYYFNMMFGINVRKPDMFLDDSQIANNAKESEMEFFHLFNNITAEYAKKFDKVINETISASVLSQLTGTILFRECGVLKNYNPSGIELYEATKKSIIDYIECK